MTCSAATVASSRIGHLEYFGPDGVLRDEAEGEFNEHGQDSWAYDQRGFDYIARDQTGYNDAHPLPHLPHQGPGQVPAPDHQGRGR